MARMITLIPLYDIRLKVHFVYCFFFNYEYFLRTNNLANNLKVARE